MTDQTFLNCCNLAFSEFVKSVPNPKTRGTGYYKNKYGNWQKCSTGNMAFNASKIEFKDNGKTCVIYIDEKIAPYVPYTNEEWISPKWKGHKNPNQDWFARSKLIVAKCVGKSLKAAARNVRRVK